MSLRDAHDAIESAFATWGRFAVRWRWPVVVATLAVSAVLGLQAPNVRSDNSAESFLRPNDPARVGYDRFRAQFGQDDHVFVGVAAPEIFDLAFLARLRDLHRAIEREVPFIDEVKSLLNARNTRGEGDQLIVEELLESWPDDAVDLAALRARILDTPSYINTLVDPDASVTMLSVKPFVYTTLEGDGDVLAGFDDDGVTGEGKVPGILSGPEQIAMVEGLMAVVERFEAPDFELHLSGGFIGNYHSTQMMMRDIETFLSISIATIGAVLFFLFRRISAVVLPLAVVLLAMVSTLGIQVVLDIPSSVSAQVVPPLLLAIGVCGAIHLMTLVYRELAGGSDRADAISAALGHSGLAIVMASLTTAAGLVSFRGAELAQVANLGTVAPIGVLVVLVYVVVLLPAMLAIIPLGSDHARGDALQKRLGAQLAQLGINSVRHPKRVLVGTAFATALAALGVSQLEMSQFPLRWFPPQDPVRLSAEFIDREFGGANTVEVMIDTKQENGLHDPLFLNDLEAAVAAAEAYDDGQVRVNKAISILDVIKETHKALNENRSRDYRIPQDRELLAQELLLFENSGSDDLEEFTDSRLQLARVSLRLPMVDDMHMPPLIEAIEGLFARALGDATDIETTGIGVLFGRSFSVINVTMARSYAIALSIITPLLILMIGNLRQGLIAMVPNLLPVFFTLGLMGSLGIPLDNSTLLVGCIIIGLAVDDTIHFMHKFQRYFAKTGDIEQAVSQTLETTGSALLFTSLVLSCGFGVMYFAYMENIKDFSVLATFAAVTAFVADVVVAPALLSLIGGRAAATHEPDSVRAA